MENASAISDLPLHLLERYPALLFPLQFTTSLPTAPAEGDVALPSFGENTDILYLYGIGRGKYYAAIRAWLKEKRERRLIVLEDELSEIAGVLEEEIAKELFFDPQVIVHLITSDTEALQELVVQYPTQRVEVVATARYKKKKQFRALRLNILRMSSVAQAVMSEVIHSHRLLPNLLQNFKRWPGSFLAVGLKNKFQNVPAIICGAGPSLQHSFSQLKDLEDRALIIAGGSTIAALSHHGITPHFGVAVDPNPEEYDRLKIASAYEMPLIYATRLQPDVFNAQNGEIGYLHSDTGGSLERHFEKQMDLEFAPIGPELGAEAFSVTTLAIALAVEMGCNPILFNGIDLAYTGLKRYADGVMPSSTVALKDIQSETNAPERLLRRKGIQGHYVHTLVKWVMESDCIGAYAKAHPDRCFYNVSPSGLGFPGIENASLNELKQKFCAPCDLRAQVHAEIQNLKMDLSREKCSQEMRTLAHSLENLQKGAGEMLEELRRIKAEHPEGPLQFPTGKMTILEIDFQEEVAFESLFPSLGTALNRLLDRAFYVEHNSSEQECNRMQMERQLAKWEQIAAVIAAERAIFQNIVQ